MPETSNVKKTNGMQITRTKIQLDKTMTTDEGCHSWPHNDKLTDTVVSLGNKNHKTCNNSQATYKSDAKKVWI
jgi:hypothetical protein